MSIKKWFREWMLSDDSPKVINMQYPEQPMLATSNRIEHVSEESAQLSFAVVKAVNGRIIKVSTYKPNPRGSDWIHELYIVKDDEKIPDVIARIMAIKALEQ